MTRGSLRTSLHRSLGKHAAFVQHGHLARDLLDERHVVLDHDERVLAGERQEELGRALRLLVAHAGDRLVEQQQPAAPA